MDDGSTDDTRQVVDAFLESDRRFKYLHQPNLGLSAARNAGIGVCTGSYIQFLDSDDMLEANKLERQVVYLEQHPEIDIVYGNVRYFEEPTTVPPADSASNSGGKRAPQASGAGMEILYPLVRRNIMVVNAPLLRKSTVDDVGGFNQTLRGYEDWDYWIRCALAGKRFQFLDEDNTFALVRLHHGSMRRNVLPMLMSRIQVRKQLQCNSLPSDLRKENDFRIGIVTAQLAQFEFANGKLLLGLRHAALAIWRVSINISVGIILQFLTLSLPAKITKTLKSAARRLRVST